MLLVAAGQAPCGDDEDTPEPGSLQGYIGVLAGLIRVPPGLEKAIEAALADSLQSIVLACSRRRAGRRAAPHGVPARARHPLFRR